MKTNFEIRVISSMTITLSITSTFAPYSKTSIKCFRRPYYEIDPQRMSLVNSCMHIGVIITRLC